MFCVKIKRFMRFFKPKRQRGFTMIELLVVIAIMGLLFTLILVFLRDARIRSRSARRIEDLKSLQNAIELYNSSYHAYPINVDWPNRTWDCFNGGDYENYAPGVAPSFIRQLPHDPMSKSTCPAGGDRAYNYFYISNGQEYKIGIQVPNGAGLFENCDHGRSLGLEDPAFLCSSNDPAWAIYSGGGASF